MVVHDLRQEAAKPHLAAGAKWADSAEAGGRSERRRLHVAADAPRCRSRRAGRQEALLAGLEPRQGVLRPQPNSPTVVRRISKSSSPSKGAHMLDAPVSGGPKGARSGKLAIWVGGDGSSSARVLLDAMATTRRTSAPSAPARSPSSSTTARATPMQTALAEVFAMGAKAGLEPAPALEGRAPGRHRPPTAVRRASEQFLQNKYEPPSFALRLAHKDVSLATGSVASSACRCGSPS